MQRLASAASIHRCTRTNGATIGRHSVFQVHLRWTSSLTKLGTKGDAHHRRAWELLLADDALMAEYERLKTAGMDSVQKAAFFERVVGRLGDSPS